MPNATDHSGRQAHTRRHPDPEADANGIRDLLKKARLGVLSKPNVENAMKIVTLQDLLKSTLGRAEWLRRQGIASLPARTRPPSVDQRIPARRSSAFTPTDRK